MRSSWLILASLALGSAGCFGSHEPPGTFPSDGGTDAGRRDAGPGCAVFPTVLGSLECGIDPAGQAFAVVTSSPSACCGSGEPSATVTAAMTGTGSRFDIALEWIACDCCAACACIGPTEATTIPLGALPPGHHVVTAHGASCTIDVGPPPDCRPTTADETLISRVLFSDQPLAVTLTQRDGRGCGCSPHVATDSEWAFSMELCGCCDDCECVDPGYQGHASLPPPPVGEVEVIIPHGVATVSVRDRASCHALEATSLRVTPPDRTLRQGGPPQTWAFVGGTETLCCAEPLPAVDVGIGPAGQIALSIHSCVEYDCDCVGSPVSFEARVSLGELPPGDHVVRAGAHETVVHVE